MITRVIDNLRKNINRTLNILINKNKMTIKINFFAGLKRYFSTPIEIEMDAETTINSVIEKLKEQKPDASNLLSLCRVAIGEEFVDLKTPLAANTEIFLIPPSSGG